MPRILAANQLGGVFAASSGSGGSFAGVQALLERDHEHGPALWLDAGGGGHHEFDDGVHGLRNGAPRCRSRRCARTSTPGTDCRSAACAPANGGHGGGGPEASEAASGVRFSTLVARCHARLELRMRSVLISTRAATGGASVEKRTLGARDRSLPRARRRSRLSSMPALRSAHAEPDSYAGELEAALAVYAANADPGFLVGDDALPAAVARAG